MGLYNTIQTHIQCSCGITSTVDAQFKYGDLQLLGYFIGDPIPHPDSTARLVAVDAVASCPRCDTEHHFDVIVDRGVIRSVEAADGTHEYTHGNGRYLVLSSI